jgi:molecular chaperone GrpE
MSEPSQNTSNSPENQPKQDQGQSQATPADMSASPTMAMNPALNPAMDSPMSPEEQEAAQAANEVDALTIAQAELATLKAKSADLADQFLRAKAEAENARRRAEDEISKARKFAVESFAESLLPVADSLEAGLAIKDASVEQIREGSQATLRQLSAALERNKVIAINPEAGAKFDPHFHQAISVVPSELEANTVVMVLQKGYSIADRVMRPALVTVSAPK